MTSFGPVDMTDAQRDKLVADGHMTPEQAQQAAAQRQQLRDLSNGAAPGFGLGLKLKEIGGGITDAIADPSGIKAMAAATGNPGSQTPFADIGNGVANYARNVTAFGDPSQAVRQPQAPLAPGSGVLDPSRAPVATSGAAPTAQLAQPHMAYGGHPGGGAGGGGLYGIANDIKKEGQAAATDTRAGIEASAANYENVSRALDDTAAVQATAAGQKAEAYQAALDEQKIQDGQTAQHLAEQQAAVGEQYKKAADADAAVAKMAVDPNRLYANKGTAGKVGAAVAVALGALGASLTKGPNYALDIINKAIDDDIDAQKTNIASARAGAQSQHTQLREMRDMVGDDVQFANILRGQHLDQVARQMDGIDMSNKPAEIQAQAAQSRALLQQQMDDNKTATLDRAHQLAASNLGAQAQVRGQAQSLAIQSREADARAAAANAKADGSIPGLQGRPVSPQAINEASKVKGAMDGMRANLKELRAIHDEYGVETFGTQRDRYDALTKDLQTQYAVLKDMGAVSGTEQEKLDAVIHNPNTFFNAKGKMDTVDTIINNGGRTRLKSLGYMEDSEVNSTANRAAGL